MRPIGGELEFKKSALQSYFTDSGRSSLRLFLRSHDHKNKTYLLPNFLCEIIEIVFKQEQVEYSFYSINDDLSINASSVNAQDYDGLYIINYFGVEADISTIDLKDKILIEDAVFSFNITNPHNAKKWFGFNSYRKISNLASGSLAVSNMPIASSLISAESAPFASLKAEAKHIKYQYIHHNQHSEVKYLQKLEQAEQMLDEQTQIYRMDATDTAALLTQDLKQIQTLRKQRFERLLNLFGPHHLGKIPSEYSFFVISLNNRDDFQKFMYAQNVFLPVHWPADDKKAINQHIISIPLFEAYTDKEFEFLIKKIEVAL
ncbi:MAG: hypothetical protein HRU28_06470 [Rhizobiales bacterium]|nr:hypothetical protein [Hyphomicrobiales bacterium]